MINEQKKKHIIYLSILFLIFLIYFSKYIVNLGSLPWGEIFQYYGHNVEIIKQSIANHDLFPLWTPYMMGGMPHSIVPGTLNLLYISGFLLLFISNTTIVVELLALINILFSGLTMYWLAYYLIKNHKAAFISGFIFMFNAWTIGRFKSGHLTMLNGLPYVPLVILFTIKAFKSKKWIDYSILTGIFLALQIWAGTDLKVTLWTLPIFAFCLIFFIFGKNFKQRLVKIIFIGIIVALIGFSLVAVRIIPGKEFIDMSSRSNMDFKSTLGGKISGEDIFTRLIEPVYEGMPKIQREGASYHIGIIAFILALIAIWRKPKNKITIFLSVVAIFSIFISMGSFIWYLIWKNIPGYDGFRFMYRTIFMWTFSISLLAGIGYPFLEEWLKKKLKIKVIGAFSLVVLLLILNLMVFGYSPYQNTPWRSPEEVLEDNYILQNISKQPGIFRIQTWETRGIDWWTDFQNVPLRLNHIFGGIGAWHPEYMNEYLGISNQLPAKFWGILNVKYITSQQELNVSGFKFINKFKECETCWPEHEKIQKIAGPYLYENEEFVSNAYITKNAILVVGEKNAAKQTMYAIMLNPEFKPHNMVIILGNEIEINSYNNDFLNKFKSIILTQGSVNQNSVSKLTEYVNNGGNLLPNLIKGEDSISEKRINDMLLSLEDETYKIEDKDITAKDFDHKDILLDGKSSGFLVISETYSLFPGWNVKVGNNEAELLRANGVVTAVYISEDTKNVNFWYMPKSFIDGAIISILSLIMIIGYLGYRFYKKRNIKA